METAEEGAIDGGFDDVYGGAGHRERNKWQVFEIWGVFGHPYSVKPLSTLLAKFVYANSAFSQRQV
jgi:hypothetical protein